MHALNLCTNTLAFFFLYFFFLYHENVTMIFRFWISFGSHLKGACPSVMKKGLIRVYWRKEHSCHKDEVYETWNKAGYLLHRRSNQVLDFLLLLLLLFFVGWGGGGGWVCLEAKTNRICCTNAGQWFQIYLVTLSFKLMIPIIFSIRYELIMNNCASFSQKEKVILYFCF